MIKKAVRITLGLVLIGSAVSAQNLADAKKAIDAEQYQKGKSILKTLITTQPTNAENYFFLGNVYLKNDYADSAKAVFNKGIAVNAAYSLNYVGLGAVDLQLNIPNPKTHFDKALSLTGKKDYLTNLYIGKAYTYAPKVDAVAALIYLEKAKATNPKAAEVYLAIGDAYRSQVKNSEAYSAYRTAFDFDKSMLRAKVELGKINQQAKAFKEASDAFNEVVAINANYGPAYRELAQTYYLWGNAELKDYDAKIKQALQYYEKYMDLTDRSLDSRIRHADFLILSRDFKALEVEATEMAKIDNVNPRVLRYQAYSAYENGNYEGSVKALQNFIAKVGTDTSRIIAKDYLYLGRGMMKTPGSKSEGIGYLKKAVQLDSTNAEVMSEIGLALFKGKQYEEAAGIYEIAVKNPRSKTIVYDSFYLGLANYFDYAGKNSAKQNPSKELLTKADSAFSYVIQRAPSSPDAYLYRARVARQIDSETALMIPFYTKYIEVVNAKGDAPTDATKKNLIEAYSNLGAFYLKSEPAKAKEYFTLIKGLDPANSYANDALKAMGGSK
jgi:tetratricopeptide (TPR) repeat protein